MSEILSDFTIVEEVPVRWADMDARGHVNNAIYYRYFEMSRIALYQHLDIYEEPTKVRVGPILSFQSCHYKAPLTFPDTVYVGAKIINIEGSKIVIKHALVSKNLNRKAAEGESHVIWYDYEAHKKVIISENLRKKLLKP